MPANARSNRPWVIASVMSSMAMTAFEATIVATAMPQIIAQLGGLSLYSWVFSGYLLAQTAMTVVFGKLADQYGRKPMILIGVGVFLVSSILAGFSWSMPSMIFFRLLQGIGAGAIQPVNLTIIGDLYPGHERAKVQGWLASVWAISAVIGPLLGGLIINHLSWAWIFWINIPVGLASAWGYIAYLHEDKPQRKPSIDVAGAVLFTLAVSALMIALTDTAETSEQVVYGAIIATVVFSLAFMWQERRAREPMISLALWGKRAVASANGAAVLTGMALMGITSFLPMYVQGVLQRSPMEAGLALTMVMMGWPAGATLGARSIRRYGPRPIAIAGGVIQAIGAVFFVFLAPGSSAITAGIGSLVMGFGMGLFSNPTLIMVQSIVEANERGSATASNLFSRNLGSTLGAALFGAVLNYGLAHADGGHAVSARDLQALLTAPEGSAVGHLASAALQHSLHLTFVSLLVIALAVVVLTLLIPPVRIGGVVQTVKGGKAEAQEPATVDTSTQAGMH